MSHTRRHSMVFALAALALLASACGSDDDGGGGGAGGAAAGASEGSGDLSGARATMVVGISNLPFYLNESCAAEKVFDEAGVEFDYQESENFDTTLQVPLLQQVVADHPDAILVSPTDAEALAAPVQEATDAGITVVLFDTTLSDPGIADGEVITDNVEAGQEAAEQLTDLISDESGSVGFIGFPPGNSVTDDRESGFQDSFEPPSGVELLDTTRVEGTDPSAAANVAQSVLAAHDDLVALVAANAPALQGTVQAVQESGREDDIVVVGFDIDPSFPAQVESGLIDVLIGINAVEEGTAAAEAALSALQGEEPEPVRVPPVVMTRDNIDEATDQVYGCSGTGT